MERRFSEKLLDHVELIDAGEGGTLSKADRTAQFFLERIAEELIKGREAFTDTRFEALEHLLRSEPEINEGEIDRALSIQTLSEVRDMTRRIVDLSKLDRVRIPSDQTALYVREAARSYIYGLLQASAAMSRVALEQALKEVLGRQGIEDFISLKALRLEAEARNILDGVSGPAVKEFFRDASEVIHHKPIDSGKALDLLDRSRGLIVQTYAAASGQSAVPQAP